MQCGFFGLSAEYFEAHQQLVPRNPFGLLPSGRKMVEDWHGPAGGHVQWSTPARTGVDAQPQLYDAPGIGASLCAWLWKMWEQMSRQCCDYIPAIGRSLFLAHMGALCYLVALGCRRSQARRWSWKFNDKAAPCIQHLFGGLGCTALSAGTGHALGGEGHHAGRPPRQTDIELWASGQMTMREQWAAAYDRLVRDNQLLHSQGEAAPSNLEASASAPEALPALTTEDRRAVHISVWLATPFYEVEIIDMGVGFPLTPGSFCNAVLGTSRKLPGYAETIIPTTPQLSSFYGSCVAVPSWILAAGMYVFVLDGQRIGGQAYAVYHRGPLTKASIAQWLPEDDRDEVDIYCFGEVRMLGDQPHPQPVQGGVIQVVYQDEPYEWSDGIETRLGDPARWNPRVFHPEMAAEDYTVYQGPDDQIVYLELGRDSEGDHTTAEDLLRFERGQCWLRSPTVPLDSLAHAGRRIVRQLAVVNPGPRSTQLDDPDVVVIFADLRGLGFFPQWIMQTGSLFDTQDYLDQLDAPILPGWTVVEGGNRARTTASLNVRDGETLTFYMKETATLTPSEGTEGEDPPEGGNEPSDSSFDDPLPDSSDLSGSPAPNDGVRRGPPPPSPVNRSRSPRRRDHMRSDASTISISLAAALSPPTFDLTRNYLQVSGDFALIQQLLAPWPAAWLDFRLEDFAFKEPTKLYEVMAAAVKTATARIRIKLRRDKAAYLTGLATSGGLAFQDVVAAAKKAGIGGRSARAPWRSLPALRDSRGALAETWEDRDRIWMAHFGDQEFGVPIPTQQLIQDDCKDLQVDVELHWAVEDVPSMLELESACRAAPRRKAIGLDGMPGELLVAAAPEVARSLFALTAKATLVLKQPLQWRGGILQEAWKRAGARDSASSYRSLFVSSVVGKGFHRLLRARTHPTNNTALHDFHLGARPKAPVLLPAMYVQNFLRWQKQLGHSAAVVFLDSQSAYYRVIRELAVGSIEGRRGNCQGLQALRPRAL